MHLRTERARLLATFGAMAISLFAMLLAVTAAPATATDPGKIVGTVTDNTTGVPVSGVCITVGPPIRCWTYTNAAGQYQIDIFLNGSVWDLYFLVTGYDQFHSPNLPVTGTVTYNAQLHKTPGVIPSPTPTGVPVQTAPPVPSGVPTAAPLPTPAPTVAPTLTVEQRIAQFWARVDALAPTDYLSATDLGQWAQNVIDRDATAGLFVADFRTDTAGMQTAFDAARIGPVVSGTAAVELRIAQFWQRVDSLAPTDRLAAADLGQWGLNVTARDPGARIRVDDFRSSTATMQGAIDRAALH